MRAESLTDSYEPSTQEEENYHVLVVDDDDADCVIIQHLLEKDEKRNFQLTFRQSLEKARNFIHSGHKVDCILLDYNLSDGTADMLIQEIVILPSHPAIVVLTGESSEQKGINLLHMGAHDYLNKQYVTTEGLSRAIRFSIERARPVTLKQQLQQEQQYNNLQSDFISILSHELKNPIHVINNSVNIVRRKIENNLHIVDKYLTNITSSTARMDTLLNKTAEYASFDPASVEIKSQKLSIYELIIAEIDRFHALYPTREFSIGSSLAVIPNIIADRDFCEQILQNIISNAVKYSPDDRPINFLFSVDEQMVTLQIQDHGRGIPKEDLAKIGQKFYRASNSGDVSGTGMGVYLVQSLMLAMRGRFQIQSREGAGTVITLAFPRE